MTTSGVEKTLYTHKKKVSTFGLSKYDLLFITELLPTSR